MVIRKENQKEYRDMLARCINEKHIPNYFSRYALTVNIADPFSSPRKNIANNEIEQYIKEISSYWNNLANNTKYGPIIRILKGELKESKEVLINESRRIQYQNQIEEKNLNQKGEVYKSLDERITFLTEKGFLTPEEVENIIFRFETKIPASEIESHIKERKILIKTLKIEELQEFDREYPCFERSQVKSLLVHLNNGHYNDIFSFLEIPPTFNREIILNQYLKLKKEWEKKPLDAKKTASTDILSFTKRYFIDSNDIQKYENTLLLLRMDEITLIDDEIKTAQNTKFVENGKVRSLVRIASEKGVSEKFAYLYILHKFSTKGIKYETIQPTADNVRCPRCFILNEPSLKTCKNCSTNLFKICPKCKGEIVSTSFICLHCGINFREYEIVQYDIKDTEQLISRGKLQIAREKIREMQLIIGSTSDIEELKKLIHIKEQNLSSSRRTYEAAIREKNFYLARGELIKLRDYGDDLQFDGIPIEEHLFSLNNIINAIEQEINIADNLQKESKFEEAVKQYYSVLAKCKDSDLANLGLKKCPPPPPRDCNIITNSGHCSFQWGKSLSYGPLLYWVIRKEGSPPKSIKDGVTIIRTEKTSAEDKTGIIGHIYYYSIFTERSGAISDTAYNCPSILLKDDIKNLLIFPGDGIVTGSWDLPGDVGEVLVLKKQGSPPVKIKECEIIINSGSQFEDRNVKNELKYYYRFFCVYYNEFGKKELSKGKIREITPKVPPPPVLDLKVIPRRNESIIQWSPLTRGMVYVYKTQKLPNIKEGSVQSIEILKKFGQLVGYSSSNSINEKSNSILGVWYYTPITIEGIIGVVGKPYRIAYLADVTNVQGEDSGSTITLKWSWPIDCKQVNISWRYDKFPIKIDDPNNDGTEKISKAQYDKKGCFEIEKKSNSHYFRIFALHWIDGELIPSLGIEPTSGNSVIEKIRIFYELLNTRTRSIKRINIISKDYIARVPELVIVAKPGEIPPTTMKDGVLCGKVRDFPIEANIPYFLEISIDKMSIPSYLKIFFSDENQYQLYQIIPKKPYEMIIRK